MCFIKEPRAREKDAGLRVQQIAVQNNYVH